MTTYAPFDATAYLDNDEVIAEYLTAAPEDPNPDVFLAALADVACRCSRRPGFPAGRIAIGSSPNAGPSGRRRPGGKT
jgi:hypothetical protein